jgi:hypothetical protein
MLYKFLDKSDVTMQMGTNKLQLQLQKTAYESRH